MGHFSNSQKEMFKVQTIAWIKELEQNRKAEEPLRNFEAEGRAALRDLEQIKAKYAAEKTPEHLAAYNNALSRALASVTLMYKLGSGISVSADLNQKTKNLLKDKFGIDESEMRNVLRTLSRLDLEEQIFPPEDNADDLAAEQLNTPEKVVEKAPPAEEVKPKKKEEPKKEEPKKEEPADPPVSAPAKKEPAWQKQTNLPNVTTTIPAAIVEESIRLIKPEKKEDAIPFSGSTDASVKAKEALDLALANRKIFQSERSQESKDAFYHNMSVALIHYSRLTALLDATSGKESSAIRSRLQKEFGILDKDLKRANTVIYRSEKTVAQVWGHSGKEEAQIEDRLLKIGAPELKTTEIKEPEPVVEPVSEPSVASPMPTEEFGPVENEPLENDRIQISVNVDQPNAAEPEVKKPDLPGISKAQLNSMKEWKETFANENPDALASNFLRSLDDYKKDLHGRNRDNTVGKLFALADKLKGTENDFVYNRAKTMLGENCSISEDEFDVALSSIDKSNDEILQDLTDLKQREFDAKYKVPDTVKNFPYSKQMIDVNSKFFHNDYDIKQKDFLAFARKHMETLQNNVKNPPLAEEGNPQKDLFDASVGMYARIRSSFDKKKWYDVLLHPIDSYREYALMGAMKETMKQNGMNDAQIESLYTGAKDVFHLDDLDNTVSLNGKSSATEANDKLIDVTEKKEQGQENELADSLNQEFVEFHGLGQKTQTKEFQAPTVAAPANNDPHLE